MAIQITENPLIKKAIKSNEELVTLVGYVLKSNTKETILHPNLSPYTWYEIPTGEIVHISKEDDGLQKLYVAASTNIRVVSTHKAEDAVTAYHDDRLHAVTAFQTFDQKWNQLFNMLTTVMRNLRDMKGVTTRNML